METKNFKEKISEVCEILETSYSLEDDVYYIPIKTESGGIEEVSLYETPDSYGVNKIECTVTVGPIVKNVDLLYTFLKNNFELDYGSFAIINEDNVDVLILVHSLISETSLPDDIAAIASYLAEVARETREIISKHT